MSTFKQLSLLSASEMLTVKKAEIIEIKEVIKSQMPDSTAGGSPRWETAMEKFKIQSIYKNCSIDNCPLLPESFVNIGRRWIKSSKKCSLYIHGNTGSGKTYFSLALFRAAIEFGVPWINFVRSFDLDEELLQSVETKQETSVVKKYIEVPVLFIDDLGVERPTERMIRQLYAIIDGRVGENRLTVITSNLPVEELPLGGRINSRLSTYYSIEFPEQDLRKRF